MALNFKQIFDQVVYRFNLANTFTDGTDDTAKIKELINEAHQEVVGEVNDYDLETTKTVATSNGVYAYAIPAGINKIVAVKDKDLNILTELSTIDLFDLINDTASTSTNPTYYNVLENKLNLYPIPNSTAGTMTLVVNPVATTLTSATATHQVDVAYENIIIYKPLSDLYAKREELETSSYYRNLYTELLARYMKDGKTPVDNEVTSNDPQPK